MKKVAIYAKRNQTSKDCKDQITDLLLKNNIVIDDIKPEVVIVIGGDGTFLRAAHHYMDDIDNILFVGINTGHLGFFSEFSQDEINDLVNLLVNDKLITIKHRLLNAVIHSDIEDRNILAINEVRIENPFHTLISEVKIDDTKLESFRGNGLVVSSSLGSSAYNKSLGGAIVDTSLDVLQLTEIASIQNSSFRSLNSSLVLSCDKRIEFSGNFDGVVLGYDFESFHLNNVSSILISLSNKCLSLLKSDKGNHINKLRESFIK